MTAFVLDASSVLAWCFEDEGGPEADALIERVAAEVLRCRPRGRWRSRTGW